jgi:ABC-type branched-subunit amino acid transport system ATPase component
VTSETQDVLRTEGVTHRFGGLVAVSDCSWAVRRGSIVALIGPNGAGKSTLANLIAGTLRLTEGRIFLEDVNIGGWPAYRRAKRGLIRVFQLSRDFEKLTLVENMLVAPRSQPGESLLAALLRRRVDRRVERMNVDRALSLLSRFGLYEVRNEYASDISGGQKRLLQLARAVMADPNVLLLDEPMAGINPSLADRICEHLLEIRREGTTIILIEHNLAVVDSICESVTVMANGRILATGTMAYLRSHHEVVDAYLGRGVTGVA